MEIKNDLPLQLGIKQFLIIYFWRILYIALFGIIGITLAFALDFFIGLEVPFLGEIGLCKSILILSSLFVGILGLAAVIKSYIPSKESKDSEENNSRLTEIISVGMFSSLTIMISISFALVILLSTSTTPPREEDDLTDSPLKPGIDDYAIQNFLTGALSIIMKK